MSSLSLLCTSGPMMKEHLVQLNLTLSSFGNTPVRRVTTPTILISAFRWLCRMSRMRSTIGRSVIRTKMSFWIAS